MPKKLLENFLKVQNGADIRGVVLDGAVPLYAWPTWACVGDCWRTIEFSRIYAPLCFNALSIIYHITGKRL